MAIKDTWTQGIMDQAVEASQALYQRSHTQLSRGNIVKRWAKEKWKERWEGYLNTVVSTKKKKQPAHHQDLGRPRDKLHQGLRKAESSLAVQLRTEEVGFAAFLHARKVSDVISPACKCGWRKEDPTHVIIFCPDRAHHRRRLYEAAGTNRYEQMMSTGKGLRAVARWVMSEGLLGQFSLAKEQSDRVEGREKRGEGEDEGEDAESSDGE